jgi:hypothetical protein
MEMWGKAGNTDLKSGSALVTWWCPGLLFLNLEPQSYCKYSDEISTASKSFELSPSRVTTY